MEKLVILLLSTLFIIYETVITEAVNLDRVKGMGSALNSQKRNVLIGRHLKEDGEENYNVKKDFGSYSENVGQLTEEIADDLLRKVYENLQKQSNIDLIKDVWAKTSVENQPRGLWSEKSDASIITKPLVPWDKDYPLSSLIWGGNRKPNKNPPRLIGRDIVAGPPGVWGREVYQGAHDISGLDGRVHLPGFHSKDIENGPPGVWGREEKNTFHRTWERSLDRSLKSDAVNSIDRKSKTGPPGVWGREEKKEPLRMWEGNIETGQLGMRGRDDRDLHHDSVLISSRKNMDSGPPGVWGKDDRNTNTLYDSHSLVSVRRDMDSGPPGVWGRDEKNSYYDLSRTALVGRDINNGLPDVWGREETADLPVVSDTEIRK